MFGAIILTFIITFLTMLVAFLYNENRNKNSEKSRILKENDGLRRQIEEYSAKEQRRREHRAYDQGLYDGRGTDALYRQCLKKYTSQDQVRVMFHGEEGEYAHE